MNCLTKLFQQKRRRIGYILAFSDPMISKRDSSDHIYQDDKGYDLHNVALIIVAKNRLGYIGDALLYTNMPTLTFSHDNPYTEDDSKGAFPTDTLAF